MAVTRGCLGIIKVKDLAATGATGRMYEVRDWEYSESAERLDSSQIGDCTKRFTAGAVETTGTINVWWDPAATSNQTDMTIANDITFSLYPGGSGSGNTYYKTPTGGANVNELSRTGGVDGIVESSFSFSVNGALTATSVP